MSRMNQGTANWLRVAILIVVATASAALSAQRVIDIQPYGKTYDRATILNLKKQLTQQRPSDEIRMVNANFPEEAPAQRPERLGDIVLFVRPTLEANPPVRQISPRWALDTNKNVIGGVFPANTGVAYTILAADPNTGETTDYVGRRDEVEGRSIKQVEGMPLTTVNLQPQLRSGFGEKVVGFAIKDAKELHALSRQKDKAAYRRALNRLYDKLEPVYASLAVAQKKLLNNQTIASAQQLLGAGEFATEQTFDGEKLKRLTVVREPGVFYPLIVTAFVRDEYDGLKYPVSLGSYRRDDTPKDTTKALTHVEYKRELDFGKEAAFRLADVVADGRPVMITADFFGRIEDTRMESVPIVAFESAAGPHVENIVSELATSGSVRVVSDLTPLDSYYQSLGLRSDERIGATHLLAFTDGQYRLVDTETDVNLGTTEVVRGSANDLFDLMDQELELGGRILRVSDEKKGKVKSFMYYRPLGGGEASTASWFTAYAVRKEQVDGRTISRFEAIGETVEAAGANRPGIRLVKVRKGEKEIGAELANGTQVVLRPREYKFLGKTYKG